MAINLLNCSWLLAPGCWQECIEQINFFLTLFSKVQLASGSWWLAGLTVTN